MTHQDQKKQLQAIQTTCKLWINWDKSDKKTIYSLTVLGYSIPDANTMLGAAKKYYDVFQEEFQAM